MATEKAPYKLTVKLESARPDALGQALAQLREIAGEYDLGGEGYFDWETLQEEDPLWYQPGDTERCEQCDGKGFWWWCMNRECPGKRDDDGAE